jgi:hypothetical protein
MSDGSNGNSDLGRQVADLDLNSNSKPKSGGKPGTIVTAVAARGA